MVTQPHYKNRHTPYQSVYKFSVDELAEREEVNR